MRALEHPAVDELSLDRVLAALADPVRRGIVVRLASDEGELACGAFELGVAKSTSTHHFRVLREAGVIAQHYRGTEIRSSVRSDDLAARFPGLLEAVLGAR